jgi:hypothetical protein
LFSQEALATFINDTFEPAWESVRPVPVVHIDFGNGTRLTRTLHGNILTSVCTADGQVLDALPGIYEETVYRQRLNQLAALVPQVRKLSGDQREEWVRDYHQRELDAIKQQETLAQFALRKAVLPVGKGVIERPVERVVAGAPFLPNGLPPNGSAPVRAAQPPLEKPEDVASWKALSEDTRLNETTRRRQIHELLAKTGLVAPEKVTRPIYKDVLHADLDDPYLGLGAALFESYPFAGEDARR